MKAAQGFKKGSQPPRGYIQWRTWADVQSRAGLKQFRCPRCKKWRFRQESCLKLGVCMTKEEARG